MEDTNLKNDIPKNIQIIENKPILNNPVSFDKSFTPILKEISVSTTHRKRVITPNPRDGSVASQKVGVFFSWKDVVPDNYGNGCL